MAKLHTHHTHNGILLSYKIEGSTDHLQNMEEPGRYYTKWNKSDRDGQKLHGIIYM